jgi:hypothetical protein
MPKTAAAIAAATVSDKKQQPVRTDWLLFCWGLDRQTLAGNKQWITATWRMIVVASFTVLWYILSQWKKKRIFSYLFCIKTI